MTDHYAILGLNKNATDSEIKAAFRKLAKIYHPDKGSTHPDAKAIFERILKAYNILINPSSRRRYDNSFNYSHSQTQQHQKTKPKNKQQKEWNFTEEELKRRQYYQQHYKAKQQTAAPKATEKPYSDYKYILYATPLAVALLMLIISMFTQKPNGLQVTDNSTNVTIGKIDQKVNGDKPYSGYFGQIKTFDTQNAIRINNSSALDAVIIIFDAKTNQYLQHSYLQSSYYIEFSKLPNDGVYWKCMLGTKWNESKTLYNEKVSGGFDSIVQYQNRKGVPVLFNAKQNEDIEMLDVINTNSKYKSYISTENDFFSK